MKNLKEESKKSDWTSAVEQKTKEAQLEWTQVNQTSSFCKIYIPYFTFLSIRRISDLVEIKKKHQHTKKPQT